MLSGLGLYAYSLYEQVKSVMPNNPLWLTGFPRHCLMWLLSPTEDQFYRNPNFNPDTAPGDKVSIYCVHGLADALSAFMTLAWRLHDRLPSNIDGVHLLAFDNTLTGASIEEYTNTLLSKIQKYDDQRVILMGHSRGGLVSSLFTEKVARKANIKVDLTVCICSPFRGSFAADYVPGFVSDSINEMTPDNKKLIKLSKHIAKSGNRYLCVGVMNDFLVLDECWLPYFYNRNTENCFYRDRHTHLSIMTSWQLVDRLDELIKSISHQPVSAARQVV